MPPRVPPSNPPGMPRPPFQIIGIRPRSPLNELQSVATWYSLAPTSPLITAHIAIELRSSGVPAPLFVSRRDAKDTAAITPIAIINPYAVSRSDPIAIDPLVGLGMLARNISTTSLYYDIL